jgi:hypothetical protein
LPNCNNTDLRSTFIKAWTHKKHALSQKMQHFVFEQHRGNSWLSPPGEGGIHAPSELLGQMTVVYVVEVPRAQYATPALSHLCIESRPNNHGPEFVIV